MRTRREIADEIQRLWQVKRGQLSESDPMNNVSTGAIAYLENILRGEGNKASEEWIKAGEKEDE